MSISDISRFRSADSANMFGLDMRNPRARVSGEQAKKGARQNPPPLPGDSCRRSFLPRCTIQFLLRYFINLQRHWLGLAFAPPSANGRAIGVRSDCGRQNRYGRTTGDPSRTDGVHRNRRLGRQPGGWIGLRCSAECCFPCCTRPTYCAPNQIRYSVAVRPLPRCDTSNCDAARRATDYHRQYGRRADCDAAAEGRAIKPRERQ